MPTFMSAPYSQILDIVARPLRMLIELKLQVKYLDGPSLYEKDVLMRSIDQLLPVLFLMLCCPDLGS